MELGGGTRGYVWAPVRICIGSYTYMHARAGICIHCTYPEPTRVETLQQASGSSRTQQAMRTCQLLVYMLDYPLYGLGAVCGAQLLECV